MQILRELTLYTLYVQPKQANLVTLKCKYEAKITLRLQPNWTKIVTLNANTKVVVTLFWSSQLTKTPREIEKFK